MKILKTWENVSLLNYKIMADQTATILLSRYNELRDFRNKIWKRQEKYYWVTVAKHILKQKAMDYGITTFV